MKLLPLFLLSLAATLLAADPPTGVRRIPPPGIAVPEADRAELEKGVAELGREIESLRAALADQPALLALLPDVQIFHKAVDWALRYDEFFDPKHIAAAKSQLALGRQRAKELRDGKPTWNDATGLVVRGYVSKIDGSVQPYGLVVPEDWRADDEAARKEQRSRSGRAPWAWRRLDVWLRGRAEKSTELAFIEDRLKNKGEFVPPGTFVLHPFGRYCNANKFAGETDLFEALADAKRHYGIDERRLVIRGFSMGGAAAWQFATHHPGMWAAAAPGAGFAETAEFHKVFAPGKEPPPWWEQVLWRWYDSTTMAVNLTNVPTIAYSGEIDGQKQAADIMLRYAEKEGVTIPHLIGPQTAHKYHPDSKPKIEEFVTAAVAKGRDAVPTHVRCSTFSLIYPQFEWVRVMRLGKHWERAEVDARLTTAGVTVQATNVVSMILKVPKSIDGQAVAQKIRINGFEITPSGGSMAGYSITQRADGTWEATLNVYGDFGGPNPSSRKTVGLCGPVDHAFMSPFLFVRPTGKPLNDAVGAWAKAEFEHATEFWRRVFRGDAPVKNDTAVTDADIVNSNLVLWGDPSSNAVFKRIIAKIPLKWSGDTLEFNGANYEAADHAPILIFPNPLNPQKYIVLNSGPTFREQALLNNADQTPKLPDWAIIDLRTPPGPKWPGLVVDAGFFDEQWRLPADGR